MRFPDHLQVVISFHEGGFQAIAHPGGSFILGFPCGLGWLGPVSPRAADCGVKPGDDVLAAFLEAEFSHHFLE